MKYVVTYLNAFTSKTHTLEYDVDSLIELFDRIRMESQEYYILVSVSNAMIQTPEVSMGKIDQEKPTTQKKKSRKR